MNKYNYTRINEELYHEVLDNGLNVYLLPKKGFSKSYATFSTNLGSIFTTIKNKDEDIINLPNGIAHFLEHKLFEQDNEDISSLFAKNQARVNAFTQNNRTTYLFSCTDNLKVNLDLLLKFVQSPSFTEEGVNKEKGIIEQEIKMYDDDPNTVAFMTLLKNIFVHLSTNIAIYETKYCFYLHNLFFSFYSIGDIYEGCHSLDWFFLIIKNSAYCEMCMKNCSIFFLPNDFIIKYLFKKLSA